MLDILLMEMNGFKLDTSKADQKFYKKIEEEKKLRKEFKKKFCN